MTPDMALAMDQIVSLKDQSELLAMQGKQFRHGEATGR